MFFSSDNWAGAHPDVADALGRAAGGFDPAYGNGAFDKRAAARFSEIFETEVAVFFVATGTAANALSLAFHTKPGGMTFCHREAHIMEDECGAPEHLGDGGRLHGIEGPLAKIEVGRLAAALERFYPIFVHSGRPTAISITQATEQGTVYELDEIAAIGALARQRDLAFHMDGARFANALVSLGTTPAEMTWKRGVDVLSFGGTKNGCWCAEAVVLFDPGKADEMAFLRKRAAQLFSKSRFVAAQFEAHFADGLWLETAAHANAMARRLADAFEAAPAARLAWQPRANEVFAVLDRAVAERAMAAGAAFFDWPLPRGFAEPLAPHEQLYRFVTSFATTPADVDTFAALIG